VKPPGRTEVRPTIFGVALAVVVVAGLALRPPTADPSVTGLVGAGLLGALVIGAVWPVVLVARVGLVVRRAPADLVAGQLGSVEVELSGRAASLSLSCSGSGVTVVDVVAPDVVRLPITVSRRGVYRLIQVDVASDAPFGIVRALRTRTVPLAEELLVGPVPVDLVVPAGELAGDESLDSVAGASLRGDAVRSVRPYVVGDPSHLVHWPSTARSGQLVVRELDPPAMNGTAIVVDLSGPAEVDEVERVASLAAGAALRLLGDRCRVVLCTAEVTGPVAGEVTNDEQIRQRLARAVPGASAAAPHGWPVHRLVAGGAVG
jgi:uncharacterized protein (DUF58 family)